MHDGPHRETASMDIHSLGRFVGVDVACKPHRPGYSGPMDTAGLIVVGSGPAAVAAAEAFREHDPDGSVVILTDDPHPPYARPPLSKDYLRGETDDVELHPPDWFDERRIELVLAQRVDGIDAASRHVTARGVDYPFQSMVLACGSSPSPLQVKGGDSALLLRSRSDAERLRGAAKEAGSAVVIGAGFIGCEAAASLAIQGLTVTLVAPDDVPQAKRLGMDAGERIQRILEDTGVRYAGGTSVEAIVDGLVHLDDGATVGGDLILAATGVRPRSQLARSAGLALSDSRIVVRSDMRTSSQHVYAAGDVAFAYNVDAGRSIAVEHWQDATDQGEVAGTNAAGGTAKWTGVPGFWTTIGDATLKYHAWGDGYEQSRLVERDDGFTIWYETDGVVVGVLTCNADDDYDVAEELIVNRKAPPVPNVQAREH
jgi:3-phenylpropionate/trans-cinnamate dioxygenase ferredoxin reductase component